MSLDLSNKKGRAHNNTLFAAGDLSTITAATFDSGDIMQAGKLLLILGDLTTDAVANTLPTTLLLPDGSEAFEDGFEITIVKNSTENYQVTFTDPITGIDYTFVDRRGESITLVFDTSSGVGQWVAKI